MCLLFDQATLDLGPFYWFGGLPNERIPDLNEFPIAKHAKGDSKGIKNPRPNIRVDPLSEFDPVNNIGQLSVRLFGDAVAHLAVNRKSQSSR